MAYEKEELKILSLEKIKNKTLTSIQEVCSFIGIGRQTFYTHKLDKDDDIKNAIRDNKITTKQTLRDKWLESDNPTLQIALYRLLSTTEEYLKLSGSRQGVLVDLTDKNNPIQIVDFSSYSLEKEKLKEDKNIIEEAEEIKNE